MFDRETVDLIKKHFDDHLWPTQNRGKRSPNEGNCLICGDTHWSHEGGHQFIEQHNFLVTIRRPSDLQSGDLVARTNHADKGVAYVYRP